MRQIYLNSAITSPKHTWRHHRLPPHRPNPGENAANPGVTPKRVVLSPQVSSIAETGTETPTPRPPSETEPDRCWVYRLGKGYGSFLTT